MADIETPGTITLVITFDPQQGIRFQGPNDPIISLGILELTKGYILADTIDVKGIDSGPPIIHKIN